MNRGDRLTVLVAATVATVGIGAGIISGAYQVAPSETPVTSVPVALNCSQFDAGAPAGNYIGGVCYQTSTTTTPEGVFPTVDTSAYGTDIPRCWEDDSNTHHVGRCYTEAPGVIVLLDADDNVVARLR